MNLSINHYNNNRNLMENAEQTNTKAAEKEAAQSKINEEYTAVSTYGDTVEITSFGKDIREDTGRSSSVVESEDGKVTKISVTADMNMESASQSYNLSTYSESELKQMYQNGEITKVEYDEELNSRE